MIEHIHFKKVLWDRIQLYGKLDSSISKNTVEYINKMQPTNCINVVTFMPKCLWACYYKTLQPILIPFRKKLERLPLSVTSTLV